MGKIVALLKGGKLTQAMLGVALVGAEWVLWLLVLLSVASVSVLLYKGVFFALMRCPVDELLRRVRVLLRQGKVTDAMQYLRTLRGPEPQVLLAGLQVYEHGLASMEDAMTAEKIRMRMQLEKGIGFLGTLGSNAPFIGLFGTVLEIIRSFRDLAANKNDINVVMVGISGALVATAMGLLVAIPAVIGFNFYNRFVRNRMSRVDAVIQDVLSVLKEQTVVSPSAGEA